MISRSIAIAVVLLIPPCAFGQGRPTINVGFFLNSPTIARNLSNKSQKDHRKYAEEVGDGILGEFLQDLRCNFPFVDWVQDSSAPKGTLVIALDEETIPNSQSAYYIRYFVDPSRMSRGRSLSIGDSTTPFIPSTDPMQPTTNPSMLTVRACRRILSDVRKSATADMVNFFLKDVPIISLPPPDHPVNMVKVPLRCMVDLPLTWNYLQADRDNSHLEADFSARNAHGKSREGTMQLFRPSRCGEDCDADVVRAEMLNFKHDEIAACPDWNESLEQKVNQVLDERLNTMVLYVKQFSHAHDKSIEDVCKERIP